MTIIVMSTALSRNFKVSKNMSLPSITMMVFDTQFCLLKWKFQKELDSLTFWVMCTILDDRAL